MAAPHITGLAALVLAHHPVFQAQPKARNAQRIDTLFQMIVAAATPMVSDPLRGGAGLPDATRLLAQVTAQAGTAATGPAVAPLLTVAQLAQLLGPLMGALAGVPAGSQLGAVLGQMLAGANGVPPFMMGAGGIYGPAIPAGHNPSAINPYFAGGFGVPPQVLMQLRALGLA